MKITFLLPVIRVGGGVKSTFELANRLHDRGHEVTVVYPWTRLLSGSKWYNFKTLLSRAFESSRWLGRGRASPEDGGECRCALAKLARRCRGSLRRLANEKRLDWFDLRAGLLRVPSLAERHVPKADVIVATWWANALEISGFGPDRGEKFYFIRHYETWGGPEKLVDRTYTLPLHRLVTSTWLKELIEGKFGVPTIGPLPNGIDFDVFYREREGFEPHSPRRIGLLYRRQAWKGMADGLEAFRAASSEFPSVRLVLFGVRPTPDDAKGIGEIEGVEYHHLPTGGELRRIYNSLDIFLFPSLCEGFGNPPMEAMACGAACVTTDVGAVRDYTVPGETALVSPPGDTGSLAANLVRLLRDEELRRALAEKGNNHVRRFTWEKTAEKLETIFASSIREREKEGHQDEVHLHDS